MLALSSLHAARADDEDTTAPGDICKFKLFNEPNPMYTHTNVHSFFMENSTRNTMTYPLVISL